MVWIMKNNKVKCFLPCRKGSERVPKKNILPFSNYEKGLLQIKLEQLLSTKNISEIILSTNDQLIIDYASNLKSCKIKIDIRPENLCSSSTSTDDLIKYAFNLIGENHVMWTHVTSPFVSSNVYDNVINTYFNMLKKDYDSLMTVSKLNSFLWFNNNPINYDRRNEKWPRTQTLNPIYEINSAVFINSYKTFKKSKDRIGFKPFLFELDKIISHDIDWPEDFILAEALLKSKIAKV